MFEMLIREVAAKFGLGDKGGMILTALLELIFKKQSGGLSAFLDLFKQKGLGSIVSSWIGDKGFPLGINSTQLENVIGGGLMNEIASKTGLGRGPIGGALAFLLPNIIRAVTKDGNIPTGIPAMLSQYLGGSPQPAVAPSPPPRPAAPPPPPPQEPAKSGFAWWWLLIPLLLLLGWCMMQNKKTEVPPMPPVEAPKPAAEAPKPPEPAPAPAPATQVNPKLSLVNDAGKVTVSGSVVDEAAKTSIMDAIKAAFGAENVSGDIGIDASAKAANWMAKLAEFLPAFKIPGAKLNFDGDDITLEGSLPQGDIDGILGKLKAIFGDTFKISSNAVAAGAAAPEAPKDDTAKNEEAGKKMDEMAAKGGVSGQDLVNVLNMSIVHFVTGSAKIQPDGLALLKKAAAAIKAAPAETKLEVGGHTDNVGNAASNMKLSQARADAVRATLIKLGVKGDMLTAKGYGDTKPKDSNDTPAGKAANRRIEYTLM